MTNTEHAPAIQSFDLIGKPWIPVLDSQSRHQELSLRDVLVRAHELGWLDDPSPLVNVGLFRLLLAVTIRVLQPIDRKGWTTYWRAGRFPEDKVEKYLQRWRERFDLFHANRPFYQNLGVREQQRGPIANLFHELAHGNNKTLFDHTTQADSPHLSPAHAARQLVAFQNAAVGGGVSKPFNYCHAPLIGRQIVIPTGSSLFETLLLNCTDYPRDTERDDAPSWEQDPIPPPGSKDGGPPRGRLDLLTWQSRRALLDPDTNATVPKVRIAQNRKLRDGHPDEPMAAYGKDDKRGWVTRPLRRDRDAWRDAHAFCAVHDMYAARPPESFTWISRLAAHGCLPADLALPAIVVGLENKQAKVRMWREVVLPLSTAFTANRALYDDLRQGTDNAEEVARMLGKATRDYAHRILAPDPDRNANPDDVSALVRELNAVHAYWSDLGRSGTELLEQLAANTGSTDAVLTWWERTLRDRALRAFDATVRRHAARSRALRAFVQSRRRLAHNVYKLLPEEE